VAFIFIILTATRELILNITSRT